MFSVASVKAYNGPVNIFRNLTPTKVANITPTSAAITILPTI